MSASPTVTLACVGCGSANFKLPPITAPAGCCFDASKLIVHCGDCGRMQTLDDATRVTL